MNEAMLICRKAAFEIWQKYAIEYVAYNLCAFLDTVGLTIKDFAHGPHKEKCPKIRRNRTYPG